jgi:hypothetical protein
MLALCLDNMWITAEDRNAFVTINRETEGVLNVKMAKKIQTPQAEAETP